MKLSKNVFKNFLFSEMPLSEAVISAPKAIFDLHSVICTNYEAFTTFSAIFTRIRPTNKFTSLLFFMNDFLGDVIARKQQITTKCRYHCISSSAKAYILIKLKFNILCTVGKIISFKLIVTDRKDQ